MLGPSLALLACLVFFANQAFAYYNPVVPGFNPDPTLLRVGDDYFLSTSTFEFFPGHPIYHSKNLADWKLIGHGLNRPSQLQLYGLAPEGGIWAPTLRYYNKTFYLFTTNRRVYSPETHQQSRAYFVTTKDIFANNWSEPTYLDITGYDADLFIDGSGTAYVSRADVNNPIDKIYGIYQTQVDLATGLSKTPDTLIFNGTLPLDSSSRPEGPHIFHRGKYFYLLLAEGGAGVNHRTTIVRGPSPSGPWESDPANPLIFNGADPNPVTQPVQGTGHSDLIELADGSWWGVCLGVRPQGGNFNRAQLGRETFLFPVSWRADWPTLNHAEPIQTGPSPQSLKATSFHDEFSSHVLDLGYYFLRTPYGSLYSLKARSGYLRLFGSPISLGDRDTPSLLLRKQTAFNQRFQTEIDFKPRGPREEAGITVFYSDFYHDDLAVTQCPNSSPHNTTTCLVHRTIVANNATDVSPVVLANATSISTQYFPVPAKPITLVIQAENLRYSFGYTLSSAGDRRTRATAVSNANVTWVGTIDSIWLSTAPDGYFLFKGAHFGLYASGGERTMWGNTADFAYLSQETFAPDEIR